MDDRDVLSFHVVYNNLANVGLGHEIAVPEEEQIAALECGFHAAREDDDNWRGGVCND